jgi:exonuclease III
VEKLTLLSWNMNQKPANWQTVLESGVDVAMLQEAKVPSEELKGKFIADWEGEWAEESGSSWRAAVAGLAVSEKIKFVPIKTQPLGGNNPNALMVSRPGSLAVALMRTRETGEEIFVVSMYATWMNPIRQTGSSWIFADASAHRLISDLSGLIGQQKRHKIIAAGDLNILHGYGEGGSSYWKRRYSIVFDRMAALGLKFVGPQSPEGGRRAEPWPKELPLDSFNVPTFHTNRQSPATATRQLDFVFASDSIADRVTVKALNSPEEWGPSDHCRVMIELEMKKIC